LGLLRDDYFLLVDEIAGKLGISSDSAVLAKKILRDAREKRITGGRRPVTLAASALYVACRLRGEWMTQRELAVAVDCSEIAIRHAYLLLKDRLGLDFSPW